MPQSQHYNNLDNLFSKLPILDVKQGEKPGTYGLEGCHMLPLSLLSGATSRNSSAYFVDFQKRKEERLGGLLTNVISTIF